MIEKLNEMLRMQKALDSAIYKEKGIDDVPVDNIRLALFDELGELNHELKPMWCWWKEHVGEVNRERVLEELVDCFHFGLMLSYQENHDFEFTDRWLNDNDILDAHVFRDGAYDYFEDIVIYGDGSVVYFLVELSKHLGFTFDDVYNGYIKKNKVNYERLESGY